MMLAGAGSCQRRRRRRRDCVSVWCSLIIVIIIIANVQIVVDLTAVVVVQLSRHCRKAIRFHANRVIFTGRYWWIVRNEW